MTGHVIHLSTSIEASPQTIWGVLTDLPHVSDILRSVKSSEVVSGDGYDVGTTWREDRTFFGHHGTEELHVTESEPPRRTIHETKLGHDKVRVAYSIQGSSEGKTKLLMTVAVDMKERSAREQLVWNTWGNISFEATRRMLAQDLDDIAAEATRREGAAGADSESGRHTQPAG